MNKKLNIKAPVVFHLPKKELPKGLPINWSLYLPTPETQKYTFDEDNCMTFSMTHTIETLLNYWKSQGLLPADFLAFCTKNGYFDVNGSFSFSVRYNSIMNGTNPADGADFSEVWDGIANYGMIPTSMLSFTMAEANLDPTQQATWNDYYNQADVTEAMKALGQQFNQFISISYDWILSSGLIGSVWNKITGQTQTSILQGALATTPIQVALYPCPSWNTGSVSPCGQDAPQHGVEVFNVNNDTSINIFDQYAPFQKLLLTSYPVPYAVAPVIIFKTKPQYTFNNNLSLGETSADVTWLQRCLAYLGLFSIAPTGYYGTVTASAVKAFQSSQGINPTAEDNVGILTRGKLNALFSNSTGV